MYAVPEEKPLRKYNYRAILWLLISIIALYVIVPEFSGFKSSWHLLSHPSFKPLLASSVFMVLTFIIAGSTYCILAFKKIGLIEESLIQLATNFINRLLPAGIGGIGANYEYLKHKGHTKVQAASVVVTNHLLGLIGHVIVVGVTLSLTASRSNLPLTNLKHSVAIDLRDVLIVLAAVIIIGLVVVRNRFTKLINNPELKLNFKRYKSWRLVLALLTQFMLTIANTMVLYYSARAVGVRLDFTANLLIFTFASAVRNFTPTPGGIGGYEAGLVSGFIAYHIASAPAIAAVLLYRIVSYWVPLAIGAVAFIVAEQKGLLKAQEN